MNNSTQGMQGDEERGPVTRETFGHLLLAVRHLYESIRPTGMDQAIEDALVLAIKAHKAEGPRPGAETIMLDNLHGDLTITLPKSTPTQRGILDNAKARTMNHPFSENFIAMAKASVQIQAMRGAGKNFLAGDWYTCPDDSTPFVVEYESHAGPGTGAEGCSWIPLLHQLLEMLGGPEDFFKCGDGLSYEYHEDYIPFAGDWHELALAVVMRTLFNKKWTGGKWVAL